MSKTFVTSLVAECLAVCVIISLSALCFTRSKHIRLPTTDGDSNLDLAEASHHDPFDIAKQDEVVDGTPLDEDEFWVKIRKRKIIQTLVLTSGLFLACGKLGLYLRTGRTEETREILSLIMEVVLLAYLVLLVGVSISKTDVPAHWSYVVHSSALSAIGFFLYTLAQVLPTGPRLETSSIDISGVKHVLHYLVIGTLGIAASVGVTIPRAPKFYFPPELVYQLNTLDLSAPKNRDNVVQEPHASIASFLFFNYVTPVVMLGYYAESLEIRDLPILTARLRSPLIFSQMRAVVRNVRLPAWLGIKSGSGYQLIYHLLVVNKRAFLSQIALSVVIAGLYYVPAWFIKQFVYFLELTRGSNRIHDIDVGWGWMYCAGLMFSSLLVHVVAAQLWSLSVVKLQIPLKIQLNTMLFAKTLVRKDVVSAGSAQTRAASPTEGNADESPTKGKDTPAGEFSSKAQIHTLMTTDVDRVSQFHIHFYPLVDAPLELTFGIYLLYTLLGSSCFLGLVVAIVLIPVNHYGSKFVVAAEDNLMSARDERVGLMNEILGAIRMLKFMAWERNFEKRVLRVRSKELGYQKQSYLISVLFNAIWECTPDDVSFYHFAVVRHQNLTPSIAFTALAVFNELRYAMNTLPETIIDILQSVVSARRIEKYMASAEVEDTQSIKEAVLDPTVKLVSASISWPQQRLLPGSASSTPFTPRSRFTISDLSAEFPKGELTLICGKLGSGKSLLLLALLGEADVLAGQVVTPRSPPDTLAHLNTQKDLDNSNWIVQGVCAYVPQTAWLQNDSIQNNILFGLPLNQERYQGTLEACGLTPDLAIIEDGDQAEIGERGVNLSGGQKARVSLARAIYSRASVLFLDDVLSAVDAHTAAHLFEKCLRGPLARGRTIVLVSHQVQLILPGASYVVALDNGRVLFSGPQTQFADTSVAQSITYSFNVEDAHNDSQLPDEPGEKQTDVENLNPVADSTKNPSEQAEQTAQIQKAPRKLIEDEARAVGRVKTEIWTTYLNACGSYVYWTVFLSVMLGGALAPALTNGWLRYWSGHSGESNERGPLWFITIYALINLGGMFMQTLRWYVLYDGSIRASTILYKRILEAVLFATVRFHDTISRGRLLNRFGKDFEGLDSKIADDLGHTFVYALNILVTFVTITYVGGARFAAASVVMAFISYQIAKVYGQTSRDLRRLDSVTRSPLYSIYGETIAGVSVIRAFGASTMFLREMFRRVDTNAAPYHGSWNVNRWVSLRFNMIAVGIITLTAIAIMLDPSIDASFAGFAISMAVGITYDIILLVRRFVGLEQSMIALERIEEFSVLPREGPEILEPRPKDTWPERGNIVVEGLAIRYAPDLPKVLHGLNFEIAAGSKIGVLGRTGGGKSTLALSLFRFVEAAEGRIVIDGLDISQLGLSDLRSRVTIIPQDPTILSGSIRSTLDIFSQYEDHEIFDALRRVHLLPSSEESLPEIGENVNFFRDLDSPVSEGGENFSAGEKQLMCMARAILKRSKILVCDEATASVDYMTDELISQTIRKEFADSTIITIAHRLRTIIDYDKVMILDQGRIAEYDEPSTLLADPASKFYALCKASGPREFAVLKQMADEAARAKRNT